MLICWTIDQVATRDWMPLALQAYYAATGIRVTRWSYTDRGAPQAEGAYLSVSHTRGLSVIAIAQSPIGIDVEHIARKIPRALGDVREWTCKEAQAKSDGIGLTRNRAYQSADRSQARWITVHPDYCVCVWGATDEEVQCRQISVDNSYRL